MKLVIANKAYSSWSLRPWILMKALDIPFTEDVIPLDTPEFRPRVDAYQAGSTVPILVDGDVVVWESLAIMDELAERFPNKAVWPKDRKARALAVCPLHTSFSCTPPQAPHILDVRTAAPEAIPLAVTLQPVSAAGLCSPAATPPIVISGCVLVLDDANVAAQAAMHIELARRRIVGGKLDAILRLEAAPWEAMG